MCLMTCSHCPIFCGYSIRESEPLSQLTHGVHLHTIRYPDEEAFAKMKEALREKGILYPQKIGQ